MLLKLAGKSLLNRKVTAWLTIVSITVSALVLFGVEHIRHQAKDSFSRTVSGVDLIVGARTGQLNLLLYSVFRVGNPSNNIGWDSYQDIIKDRNVVWSVPISLGDSHRGYRVMGTSQAYFDHFRYGNKQLLAFSHGEKFNELYDVVVGSEVAKQLEYELGDQVIIAHGMGKVSFKNHDDHPFTIVGILKPTGTPVDQTVHVSVQAIQAIHSGKSVTDFTPKSITAFMLGLKSKLSIFSVQRKVNNYRAEPLMAILPGVALSDLWKMMSNAENVLRVIAVLVLFAALVGMTTMLLASMQERQRELAVLRAIGSGPFLIAGLIQIEALLLTLIGLILAGLILWLGISLGQDYLSEYYGLYISANVFTTDMLLLSTTILVATFFVSLIPALTAYYRSLHSGLTVR